MRHVHPAPAGRRHGRRGVSEAFPRRPRPGRYRGYLPVGLREIVLARRPCPEQRPGRRGHGAVGYKRQEGRDADTSTLRGQCRHAVALYAHATGSDFNEVENQVRRYMEDGYRYVRCQISVPGYSTYGSTISTGPQTLGLGDDPWEPTP